MWQTNFHHCLYAFRLVYLTFKFMIVIKLFVYSDLVKKMHFYTNRANIFNVNSFFHKNREIKKVLPLIY